MKPVSATGLGENLTAQLLAGLKIFGFHWLKRGGLLKLPSSGFF
jgi:hypothetical protein